jgi:hypothetical protein
MAFYGLLKRQPICQINNTVDDFLTVDKLIFYSINLLQVKTE